MKPGSGSCARSTAVPGDPERLDELGDPLRLRVDHGSPYPGTAVSVVCGGPSSRPSASIVTTVPASPAHERGGVGERADRGGLPVRATNEQAACTFGPIEPAANSDERSAVGPARRIAR